MRRISRAGFKKGFVQSAILPDWWDDSCSEDPSLLQDIEIRLARFLGLPLAVVEDANAPLAPPLYPAAQLRRVRDVDRDLLGPAIHAATRIAEAVVRNLRDRKSEPIMPPADSRDWRKGIKAVGRAVTLDDIISDLWKRGIPVVPIEMLPMPSFQGMCCIVESRPVILLGHKHDEPGRVAFLVAHEVGHVTAGDCAPERPVVDEEDEITDETDIELKADRYATQVLIGSDTVPKIEAGFFKDLARDASDLERRTGADASMMIFAQARRTGDYAMATMAVKALYRHQGARQQLHKLFDRHVDVFAAADTDRALLRCVYEDPEPNEAVG
jgi:Zn-dependent peptidase ImmA (M78 family)